MIACHLVYRVIRQPYILNDICIDCLHILTACIRDIPGIPFACFIDCLCHAHLLIWHKKAKLYPLMFQLPDVIVCLVQLIPSMFYLVNHNSGCICTDRKLSGYPWHFIPGIADQFKMRTGIWLNIFIRPAGKNPACRLRQQKPFRETYPSPPCFRQI